MLSREDHGRIEAAIAAAEASTRGEIVCAVTEEAGVYAEVPLAWAAAMALVLPLVPLAALGVFRHLGLAARAWSLHLDVITAVTGYVFVQCILFLAVFVAASVPAVRRWLTPALIKRKHVRARATEQFLARGLDRTRERIGVLIFVSLKDRQVEILADIGVSEKIAEPAWREVVADLVGGVRAGRPADGFVAAVARAGRLLAEHFPAGPDNPNELSDSVVDAPSR
ncbi:MAG: TPM domain-containing protein [Pseudomonadota bacterium]|jgi:putative membrane protein